MRRHTKHIQSRKLQINPVRVVLVSVPLLLLIGVISFFRYYTLQNVTVLGNVHYTDEEIREEVTQGLFGSNTWIISRTKSSFSPDDLELVDQIDVKMKDNHSLQVTVQEHQLIGYVQYLDCDLYFDSDGRVMDSVVRGSEEDSTSQGTSDSASGSAVSGTDGTADGATAGTQDTAGNAAEDTTGTDTAESTESGSTTGTSNAGTADGTTGDSGSTVSTVDTSTAAGQVFGSDTEALTAEAVGKTATSYMSAMKEAPLITGLSFESAQLHEILPVADTGVFYTILGISRMINKYDITPDAVNFDENMQITLTYGDLTVDLGEDQQIEEKLARVAAILPSIEGKSGILHMEDYDGSSQNIVFSQSVLSGESLDEEGTTTSTAAGLTTETKKSVSHEYALVQKQTQQTAASGTDTMSGQTTDGQTTDGQTGTAQDGSQQTTGTASDGTTQSGTDQTGTSQSGTAADSTTQSGTQQSGTTQSDTTQSGTQQSGTNQDNTAGSTGQGTSSGEIQIDRPVLGNLQ